MLCAKQCGCNTHIIRTLARRIDDISNDLLGQFEKKFEPMVTIDKIIEKLRPIIVIDVELGKIYAHNFRNRKQRQN